MDLFLEHVGLAAWDPVALRDWYGRVFGAREIFCNRESSPAFLLELSGGMILEIYPAASENPSPCHNRMAGWRHLALRVDSIEAAEAELTAAGVAFQEPVKPAGGGGRVLFFQDPEGNLLHLVERPRNWKPA